MGCLNVHEAREGRERLRGVGGRLIESVVAGRDWSRAMDKWLDHKPWPWVLMQASDDRESCGYWRFCSSLVDRQSAVPSLQLDARHVGDTV